MELAQVSLQDKYERSEGRAFVSGLQALVRLPVIQAQRDRAAGLNTGGFISGYRGSPLGQYDLNLSREAALLGRHGIHFTPAINEDLGVTAVWGTQQVGLHGPAKVDGVFAIWYGKGPGVDRSMDALKHGNYAGAARHGGVLVVCGDDHNAQSSSLPHQSEQMLQGAMIPILNPANVQEYVDFGLLGFALSRYSGCWVGFKAISDTVESAATIDLDQARLDIVLPPGAEDVHIRASDTPLAMEARVMGPRMEAVHRFARANHIDRVALAAPAARLGIVATGKAYLDVRQALEELGLDAQHPGLVSVYKVGLSWPLEPQGIRAFAQGLDEILVVEEKRAFVEDQLVKVLYRAEGTRPAVVGKADHNGLPLLPSEGELDPAGVARAIAARVRHLYGEHALPAVQRKATPSSRKVIPIGSTRIQYFCSGCPHNSSTKVPEGSRAMAGVGCHGMVTRMQRHTSSFTHMGAEGVNWVGQSPFTLEKHVFQNMGDGTYFHSGILAIRQSIAARVNITYKLLFNAAVAMTGGQPLEGTLTVPQLVDQLVAEGVAKVVVVSDEPEKYPRGAMRHGVEVHHRSRLDEIQRELRGLPGVTALVYDQTCAAEKRRLRKRGKLVEPAQRVFINDAVCEACGDCSVQSNCVSIKPLETELGRKRTVDQSNCNKDYSCVTGFCPSFVTVTGASVRKAKPVGTDSRHLFGQLPTPQPAPLQGPCNILVTGIGGTGVLTIGALLGMAALLEHKASSVLDFTGVAQKNGAVMSHVRLARDSAELHSTRLASGSADLLIGCDLVVSASPAALSRFSPERTEAVVNAHLTPTAAFTLNGDVPFESDEMQTAVQHSVKLAHFVSATPTAEALLGDSIGANLFLVGYALQKGLLPLSVPALERAIELNGVSVAMNQEALAWGRLAAHDPAALEQLLQPRTGPTAPTDGTLESLVQRLSSQLEQYQDARYAQSYTAFLQRVMEAERARVPEGNDALARTVARALFKLMSYKDEYEVARLYTDGAFLDKLKAQFEGDLKLQFHLAPPLLARRNARGEARKRAYGPWMFHAFKLLARMKGLRGSVFDPFGHTAERRSERSLIVDYRSRIEHLLPALAPTNHALALEVAAVAQKVRGFGHVRERNLHAANEQWRALQARWEAGPR
ncbi:MAG: indolepyruvate ferredoxin oxidoreductase family protein [Hydrogenophaga sp.]|nr:indolepyruvate ferredoxin oxidoreductase family protein [Hydrogenophaga sp.]